jgi:hypothetical protein
MIGEKLLKSKTFAMKILVLFLTLALVISVPTIAHSRTPQIAQSPLHDLNDKQVNERVQTKEEQIQRGLDQISKLNNVTPRRKAEAFYKLRIALAKFIEEELNGYSSIYYSKVTVTKFTNRADDLRAQAKKDFEPFLTPREKYLLQQFKISL